MACFYISVFLFLLFLFYSPLLVRFGAGTSSLSPPPPPPRLVVVVVVVVVVDGAF
jgi:predicted AlkP superfamily pyrophosphatase or phosphodiesterase